MQSPHLGICFLCKRILQNGKREKNKLKKQKTQTQKIPPKYRKYKKT
jgi:hypothetical protein